MLQFHETGHVLSEASLQQDPGRSYDKQNLSSLFLAVLHKMEVNHFE